MARQESDREDLMADATALRPRIELSLSSDDEPFVAGQRANGGWSLYFGPDPAFHFDAEARLRRSFCDDQLYRTQGATLAAMTRSRTATATHLLRHDLSPEELADFLARMQQRLTELSEALQSTKVTVLHCVGKESPAVVLDELRRFLHRVLDAGPQLAPAISGKR